VRKILAAAALTLFALPAGAQHLVGWAFNGSGVLQLVDLNAATGATAFIGASGTDINSMAGGKTAYDIATNTYFVVNGGNDFLYKISAANGTYVKVPVAGANVLDIEWSGSVLYALMNVSGNRRLATIDTTTGTISFLGAGNFTGGALPFTGSSLRLDAGASRTYFIGSPNVYGVSLSTYDVYASNSAPALLQTLIAGGGNLWGLQLSATVTMLQLNTTTLATLTTGSPIPGGALSLAGKYAYDAASGTFYFVGNATQLYAMSTATLALVGGYPIAMTGTALALNIADLEFAGATLPVSLQRFRAD
jgi:hypothetical protein